MININIDLNPVLESYRIPKNVFKDITQTVIEALSWNIYNNIRQSAQSKLRSTRNVYINNLNYPDISRLKGIIVLTGNLPNMLESGAPAFDMKSGFMKSPKVKKSKNGWYMTIPFRWGAPGSLAENEAFSNKMPKEIHDIVKGLTSGLTVFGGRGRSGQGIPFGMLPSKHQSSGMRGAFTNMQTRKSFGVYVHKNPIHQGIQKKTQMYQNAMQNTFVSFRRVSDKSDSTSWIHRGFERGDFFGKGINNTDGDKIVGNVVSKSLEDLGI
jgi:hypothetical protein